MVRPDGRAAPFDRAFSPARYGDGEAERVIGEAFGGRLPGGVGVTTKCRVSNPPADEVPWSG